MDRYAWADASLLLLLAAIAFVAGQPGVDRLILLGTGLCVVAVAHVALIITDYVRNAGTFDRFPNVVVGIVLPPVYFGWRSMRFRYVNGWLMILLWCVGLVAQAVAADSLKQGTLSPRLVGIDVATQLEKIVGQPVTADCPNNVPAQPGRTFRCSALTVNGARFPVVVVVTGTGVEVIAVPIFDGGVKPS